MPKSPFDDPLARLANAGRHISTLKALEATYFSSGAFQWFQENRGGVWTNGIRQVRGLPDEIEFAAWDAMQNLRSSLDLAVCAAAKLNNASDLKNTYFHFASDENEWDKSYKGRTKAVPQYAIDIMRKFKPWGNGNNTLYALSRISAVTRHQIMTPIALGNNSFIMSSNALWNGPGPHRIGIHTWNSITQELVITETGFPIPIPINGYQFTTFLAFGPIVPVSYEPIVPMLHTLVDTCQEIIHDLEFGAAL